MIRTWKITKNKLDELHLADTLSLDAVTRQLTEGYYSTFRTFDSCTRVIGLSAHMKRLPHANVSDLQVKLLRLLQHFSPGEARVRLTETRNREFYISIEPLKPLSPETYEKGVVTETIMLARDDPRVKSTAFIAKSGEARKHIARAGIFEALLVKNGRILEGMTSNFFYVLNSRASSPPRSAQRGVLCTAQRGILLGVTRTMVIRAARGRGAAVCYRPLRLDELSLVTEAFITSSSRGIVPVIQIDDVKVGQGSPGKLTRILMSAYEEYVLNHAERI